MRLRINFQFNEVSKNRRGFTIVELLIVIVVIAILAAITIVAYNGIQQRSNNAQIQQTTAAWVKAIRAYRIENGSWPPGSNWTCLGEGYKYGPNATDTPGDNQCSYNESKIVGISRNEFDSAMRSYMGGSLPTPVMVTGYLSDTDWQRGIMFTTNGGSGDLVSMRVMYSGDITCPSVPSTVLGARVLRGGNAYCLYSMGNRLDPL